MGNSKRGEFMNTVKKQTSYAFSQFTLTNKLLQNLYKYKLTPTAKLVLLELSTCYNPKHGDMFPKQKTLANRIGVSEASVIRAISELHKEGLIISERKYTNRYKFTSKILNQATQNEYFLQPNDMQVENSQNVTSKACNLQGTCIEQKKEQKRNLKNNDDDKYLIQYAEKRGIQNKIAYINAIKKNGGAQRIINEYKQIEINKRAMANKTANYLKNVQIIAATSEPPTETWKALKQILLERKNDKK